MKIFREKEVTYDNDYLKSLSCSEQESFLEGVALGQRMAATIIDSKFGNIQPNMNSAVTQLIFKDIKDKIIVMLNMTKEQVKEMLVK